MENPFKKKIEEKKEMERLNRELLKEAMIDLKEEMAKDESVMTEEEKERHVKKIEALRAVFAEVKGEDKAKGKQIALQVGLKAGLVILGVGLEALLLKTGSLTKLKEKLIDNIIRC